MQINGAVVQLRIQLLPVNQKIFGSSVDAAIVKHAEGTYTLKKDLVCIGLDSVTLRRG